jgi:hypothetical protein
VALDLESAAVSVIRRDDVIRNKRATGRPGIWPTSIPSSLDSGQAGKHAPVAQELLREIGMEHQLEGAEVRERGFDHGAAASAIGGVRAG